MEINSSSTSDEVTGTKLLVESSELAVVNGIGTTGAEATETTGGTAAIGGLLLVLLLVTRLVLLFGVETTFTGKPELTRLREAILLTGVFTTGGSGGGSDNVVVFG
jgi:hypothetical protein